MSTAITHPQLLSADSTVYGGAQARMLTMAMKGFGPGSSQGLAPGERGVGRRGSAYAYNVKELRNIEKAAPRMPNVPTS
ncbi:MAG: hypothetical protein EOQ39_33370 [Mesorhizobium sp.]|uniref:hypothetical protein n=1 Tax=Mesorhizobium sp. TaxID=1871066 RepID=UPI000FE95E57|nr:hypothetical protein [Mesorhizobium sp.]RWA98513.1 MAG: hypothetical protein EOQ37_32990 [Mesorhizobium sp.]RWB09534.1 MAG: hypothetical protein EOQ39_33370 [Mesorhizobium sp.]